MTKRPPNRELKYKKKEQEIQEDIVDKLLDLFKEEFGKTDEKICDDYMAMGIALSFMTNIVARCEFVEAKEIIAFLEKHLADAMDEIRDDG